ncbi:MAG: type II toxin-antitoxin system RelE/ParE family toxin [Planifilum fimeticola]
MKKKFHPEFFDDFLRIRARIADPDGWEEFKFQYEKAERAVILHPEEQSKRLRKPPLVGYRCHKFKSSRRLKGKADMRLVFRIDREQQTIFLLGLGFRFPEENQEGVYDYVGRRAEKGPPTGDGD